MKLVEVEYPYPKITVTQFEGLVREVYETLKHKGWTSGEYPIEVSVEISRILVILQRQPELLANDRLRYNLGKKKTEWLDKLWDAYNKTK